MNYGDNSSLRYLAAAFSIVAGTALLNRLWNAPSAKARRAGAKLPPGPKRDFLIGNFRNFPKNRWYETFTRWREDYGDIIYLDLAGSSILVLNSLEVVEDLMEKRANIYSGRGYTTMVSKLMNQQWFTVNAQPGPIHNDNRKVTRLAIGPQTVANYDSFILNEKDNLLKDLEGFQGDPRGILARWVGAIIFKISYGERIYNEHGEEMIKLNLRRAEKVTGAFPRIWAVNIFPVLQYIPAWFPGASFRRLAREVYDITARVRSFAFELVEKDLANGVADESIVSRLLGDPSIPRDRLRDAVGTLYAAGFDTTSSSITNFFYSLMLHPHVQRRIQKELDECIGVGGSPTMAEIQTFHYFKAAWNESMRLNVTSPLGIAHLTTEEDIYKGYYIPKGSNVFANIGCILRDPKLWGEDAGVYNPERFLPECNPRAKQLPDMSSIPFGFGNRVCPGRHLSERTALLFTAAVLSAFEIVPMEGESGEPTDFVDSVVRRPIHFRCKFVPRQ